MDKKLPSIPAITVSEASTLISRRASTVSLILDEPMSNETVSPHSEVSTDNESSAKIMNSAIHRLMKEVDGRYYIPRTDLMKLTSEDMIRQIIREDQPLRNMTLEEEEAFAHKVQQKARTLLALCVYARVAMRCLKKLLDRSLSDESLPLCDRHCCHKNCGGAFRDLLAKQGSFMAPIFNSFGQHIQLPSCVVLPIHFVSKVEEKYGTPSTPESVDHGVSLPPETEEQALLRQKSLACCGSGAYSTVYRVRIHRDHHIFSEVKRYLSKP